MRWVCDSTSATNLRHFPHSKQCATMERTWPTAPRAPCRNFASRGSCRFGDRCRFSHDVNWRATRPPPEMTPCFHWEEAGACPRGSRCAYLHRPEVLAGMSLLHDNLPDEVHTFVVGKPRSPKDSATLANLKHITSYDWLIAESPTIGVPGKV